jgi:hypothetical protein
MPISSLDGGYPPFDHFLRGVVSDRDVRLDQIQLRNDGLIWAQILQHPDQDQLRIRIGIDPQIDHLERLAEIDDAGATIGLLSVLPVDAPHPIIFLQ